MRVGERPFAAARGDRLRSSRPIPPARFAIAAVLAAAIALVLPAFASANQTLSVQKNGSGTGTVTSSPAAINCGATCSASFTNGATVVLIGTAGANSAPVQWSGCESVNLENKCIVTMSTAKTVTATFNLLQRQLTVTKSGSGSGTVTSFPSGINCGGACSAGFGQGTSVTLSGVADADSQAVQWSGCSSLDGENHCLVTMSTAKAVTATFNLAQRQLTVSKNGTGTGTVTSSPAGISCGATCSASYPHGTAVTLSGAPDAGTTAAQWSGCDSVNAEDKCLVTMSAAKAVTATFNHPQFQLTVSKIGSGTGTVTSSPAGIDCGGACQAGFDQGTTVTLTGAAGIHTQAVKWSGCTSVNGENKCIVTLSAAKAVTASFELEPQWVEYAVTVSKTGTGQGTVSGSPGSISCGTACSGEFVTGTKLTLTASPAPGSVFAHWSGGGCTGAGPCTTTVKSAKTVKAIFTAVGVRTLSVTKAGTGQGTVTARAAGIDCGPTCLAQVPAAKKVTLSAKPAAGSAFAHWSGACSGAAKTCKVTMTEARSVTATFTGPSAPAPPPPSCVVPRLAGKSPDRARSALRAAHCALGKVSKPKARKGHKLGPLVVKSSSPGAGTTLPAGAKVDLKLKKGKHKRSRGRHGRSS